MSQKQETNNPIKNFEEKYPEASAEYKKITKNLYKTLCKKALDYGPENITLNLDISKEENKKMSLLGLWFRTNDKINRVKNILLSGKKPNNESIEDSWLDMANYAIISLMVNRNKWLKNK